MVRSLEMRTHEPKPIDFSITRTGAGAPKN